MGEYAEYGFDQQGWYGMFVACGIWCLADVSSVSPSLETSAKHHIPQATNIPYQPCWSNPYSGIKGQAPPLFTPQDPKFKILILHPRQTWRMYKSCRSKYMNSKEWGFIPYFSDYKSTRCISRPLFFSCKMMIFSDTLSISRLPQSLFFTYNCMNSYKIIDHIKSDKTKSKKLFQYCFNFLLKPDTPTFNSWKCFTFVSKPMWTKTSVTQRSNQRDTGIAFKSRQVCTCRF